MPDWRPKGLRGAASWHLSGHLSLGAGLRQDRLPDAANKLRRDPCFRVTWDNKPYVKTFQYMQNRAYAQARTPGNRCKAGAERA